MNILIKILIILLFIAGVAFLVINQRNNLKEWLLYAVVEAEKGLGSKMGQIKLRQVYDEFIFKYPLFSKLISFKLFSGMVDNALVEMKGLLSSNVTLRHYIKGDA